MKNVNIFYDNSVYVTLTGSEICNGTEVDIRILSRMSFPIYATPFRSVPRTLLRKNIVACIPNIGGAAIGE